MSIGCVDYLKVQGNQPMALSTVGVTAPSHHRSSSRPPTTVVGQGKGIEIELWVKDEEVRSECVMMVLNE